MFTNTSPSCGVEAASVAAMMAAALPWLVLLAFSAAARDIKANTSDYVVRHTDSCPDVGYYLKRDPAPNAVTPGGCYLCFCQTNDSAICWQRENQRCDVERRYGLGRGSRIRRSPVGLSDIFFRDAARDFFDRQIPGECKPYESSFSDGCPPVDWCTGCTICDCDANGHWDCHILSFCNGKERKEKVKNPRKQGLDGRRSMKTNNGKPNNKNSNNPKPNNPKPNIPKPNNPKPNNAKPINQKPNISKPNNPKPNNQKHNNPKPKNLKPRPTSKPTKRGFIKKNDQSYVPVKPKNISKTQIMNKPHNKPSNIKPVKISANKNNNEPKLKNDEKQKPQENNIKKEKPQDKRLKKRVKKIIIKRQLVNNNKKNSRRVKKQQNPNVSHIKMTKRGVSTPKPTPISLKGLQGMNMQKLLKNNNDSLKLGQKIVKQVMSSVQKILMREMEKIDETRKHRRSVGDCGQLKQSDREALNVKSNAATRNKNKYNVLTTKLMNLEHARKKREILNETQAKLANVNIISLDQTENTAVIPLWSKTQIKLLNTSTTGVASSSTGHNKYYKYSIKENIIDTNLKTTQLTELKVFNYSEKLTTNTPLNTRTFLTSNENTSKTHVTAKDKFNNITNKSNQVSNVSIIPEVDNVKFTKWYLIKIMQNNTLQTLKKLHSQNKPKAEIAPKAMKITAKVPSLDVPILSKKKTLNTEKIYTDKITSQEVTETVNLYKKLITDYTPEKTTKKPTLKVIGLPNILQNILTYVRKNKSDTPIVPSNTTGVIKNLRTFFNKLFNKKANRARKNKYGLGPKEERTLQILCEHFVRCKVNKKTKFFYSRFLKYKLIRLNEESESILKSIRIIKGLLHLLDPPKQDVPPYYNTSNNTVNVNPLYKFQSDLQKFSSVLKGTYNDENLTETQKIQIRYIKKNTQEFKKSVQRFANILKEILMVLKQNVGDDTSKDTNKDKGNGPVPLNKIKALLSKYNLVQNSFISRMFKLLKRFEDTNIASRPKMQVSEDNVRTINDSLLLQNSKTIINNLRKLKSLAQALNSKRKKRHTDIKRDDALEYLLTLLEYLLKKQSQPLDYSPENDGIDFLIDAIKSAPDIKPIKKKVLQYSFSPVALSSVTLRPTSSVDINVMRDSDDSDNNQVIKEDNKDEGEVTSTDDVNFTAEENEASSRVYYVKPEVTESYNDISSHNSKDSGANKIRRNEKKEKVGFDKFESNIDTKKFDVGDILEETTASPATSYQSVIKKVIDEITTPVSVTAYVEISKDNKISSSRESEEPEVVEKKRKLEWIEATFDRDDIDDVSYVNASDITTNMTETLVISKSRESEVESEEVTDIEHMNAYIARPGESLGKPGPEEVMQRKQMEFLRSLDYGKPESDDSESKDDPRSYDVFPSYF